jgi:hypothetical protein
MHSNARFTAASTPTRSRARTLPVLRMLHVRIHALHGGQQHVFLALGAGQHIVLLEDARFDLAHGASWLAGRRSISASTRARAACRRAQGIALLCERGHLLGQQGIGALKLGVAQQQAINTLCQRLDHGRLRGHRHRG